MTFALRGNQNEFISGIGSAYARGVRSVCGVASTGFGKTACFAEVGKRAAAKGNRVLVVAHRVEIVEQISLALDRLGVRHGRIMPGHHMTGDMLQVGMIATVARRLDRVPTPALLIVDECHHATSASYLSLIAAWPAAKILGVTATPRRLDGRGLGEVFDALVEAIPMADLIAQGYLAGYDYLAPPQMADTGSVSTRAGDFAVDELAAVMDKSVVTGDAVEHYAQHLNGRPAIAFCVRVDHAEHVAQQFQAAGFRAASVDGTMDARTRRDRIAAIGDGRLNVLTSCALISEGTDVPTVAGAILLRPTKSLSMWLQQVGRCLRPKSDGSRAVILDHVGSVHRFGMPDAPRAWSLAGRAKGDKEPGISTCEKCYRAFSAAPGWRAGAECAWDFPNPEGCILNAPAAPAEREMPEVVAGQLAAMTATPVWAGGINVVTAAGHEFREMLRHANTPEKLREIAQARGYKPGWVHHILAQRASRRVAA